MCTAGSAGAFQTDCGGAESVYIIIKLVNPGNLTVDMYICTSICHCSIRQKKINVFFPETSKYFYGSVGRQNFFFRNIFLYRKSMKIIQN